MHTRRNVALLLFLGSITLNLIAAPHTIGRPEGPLYKARSYGVPACPYPIEYMQPDGSKITYYLKGDGAVHWRESIDGYPIIRNADGFYEYASITSREDLVPSGIKLNSDNKKRSVAETNYTSKVKKGIPFSAAKIHELRAAYLSTDSPELAFPSIGTRNLLLLLVEFPDSIHTFSPVKFDTVMNIDNNDGTGSFRKYYYENSYGALTLVTEVSNWFKAPQLHSYYGDGVDQSKTRARQLVRDVVDSAEKAGMDFSVFDNDGDHYVDGVMVIHQGDGAENGNNENIWSHSWQLSTVKVTYDGVTINAYTINPETKPGRFVNGIGVLCHEFGHNLGLSDYYDTDYANSGGTAEALGSWDCMDVGSYNNGSNSPPYHNAYSKNRLSWLTQNQLTSKASVTMTNIEQHPLAYYFTTPTSNEYFILENRQKIGFDLYIPGHGMLIYHVDGNFIGTAGNCINCNPTHQGFDLVEADGTSSHSATDAFPGTLNRYAFTDSTTPNAKSWATANSAKPITNIEEISQTIYFGFMNDDPLIWNVVTTPLAPTATDSVRVSAKIYGNGSALATTILQWCTDGTSFNHPVTMFLVSDSTYTIRPQIPPQSRDTVISYRIIATTAASKTTTSPVYRYVVSRSYCSGSGNSCHEFIARVKVGSIDNQSSCGGYQDFSTLSTDLQKGSTYPMTVYNGYPYPSDQCGIWVDWNQNGIFDAAEKITVTASATRDSFTAVLTPPVDAVQGKTRLRTRMLWTGTVDPCGTTYGEVEDYSLNVLSVPQYTLTVNAGGGGSITAPSTSPVTVNQGALTVITASPGAGYDFVNWTVTSGTATIASATSASTTVALTSGNATVQANFELKTYQLALNAGTGGTITTPSTSSVTVNHGAATTITASPGTGYDFVNWTITSGTATIASATSASTTVTLTSGNATVQANFALKTYQLTLSAGTGGTITTPSTSSITVNHGAATTITASPGAGYDFVNWTITSGTATIASATSASTTVTLTSGNATVQAHFDITADTLTLTVDSTEGSVAPSMPIRVRNGTDTAIVATAKSGYFFDRWTAVSGSATVADRFNAATRVSVSGNTTLRADFVAVGGIDVTITGGSGKESVYLYTTNGWQGRGARTGSGVVAGLKPGRYRLAIKDSCKRSEFLPVIVAPGDSTDVSVGMHDCVMQLFDSIETIRSDAAQLSAGGPGSPVLEDFNGDGATDLLIGKKSGDFSYYQASSGNYILATAPQTAGAGDLTWSNGILCLRAIDWNGDNRIDLLILDQSDRIVLFSNTSTTGAMVYDTGRVLYTSAISSATGFDLGELNGDGFPDLTFGFTNGQIGIALSTSSFTWTVPMWNTLSIAKLSDQTTALDAGTNATPLLLEVTGDGLPDLLVGNGSGSCVLFRNRGDDTWLDRGIMSFGGKAAALTGGMALSVTCGAPGDLPMIVMADGAGALFSAQAVLAGDCNGDGSVDIADLQIFGDAWGLTSGSTNWNGHANFDVTPSGGNQIIDILDLVIFGDNWGAKKK